MAVSPPRLGRIPAAAGEGGAGPASGPAAAGGAAHPVPGEAPAGARESRLLSSKLRGNLCVSQATMSRSGRGSRTGLYFSVLLGKGLSLTGSPSGGIFPPAPWFFFPGNKHISAFSLPLGKGDPAGPGLGSIALSLEQPASPGPPGETVFSRAGACLGEL